MAGAIINAPAFLCVFVGRQLVQFFHQMRDHTVATESMILLIDVPHDLSVGDRVVSILHVATVTLVEAISQQGNHCLPDRLLVIGAFAQLLQLPVVHPSYDSQREHAKLLNPVFLDDFLHCTPVHRHSPFMLYLNPGSPAVVVRGHLNPCTVVVIVDSTLNPCAAVVVPYGSCNIRHRYGNGADSGIVG